MINKTERMVPIITRILNILCAVDPLVLEVRLTETDIWFTIIPKLGHDLYDIANDIDALLALELSVLKQARQIEKPSYHISDSDRRVILMLTY